MSDVMTRGDEALLIDPAAAEALAQGRVGDPFALLGPHQSAAGTVVRVYVPGALAVEAIARSDRAPLATLEPRQQFGLFMGLLARHAPYILRITWPGGVQETEDPYSFGLLLGELDLYLITEGRHWELAQCLGARAMSIDGVPGARFALWAPNARRCSVVGDFNVWDGRRHLMRRRIEAGVWELFVPRLGPGERYKFELIGADGQVLPQKSDPLAQATEAPPATASVVADAHPLRWTDATWMAARPRRQAPDAPMSVYEVHAGSWLRPQDDRMTLNWDDLAERLVPYVAEMGFTHVELMPVMEHPFGGSWGYQPIGMFAPSGRFGPPEGFGRFVDACHAAGVGVLVDWVPAHFPTDAHGLGHFDGTALYEHADPREGFHHDWNTLIYNLGRREVRGFLIASALHWLEHFHVDGLRVDAVASMLYRDYSRNAGEWVPNRYGGRENLEAIEFLRTLNETVRERCPGAVVVAEESTSYPGVSHAIEDGGLGFAYKWNMGWMHDTLHYIELDPIYRQYNHRDITFGLLYAFAERFTLPLSHDEVVYGKGSMIRKMPGDEWQRFANLRAYYGLMWTYPGKKLLFMGGEIAQEREWNHDAEIDWWHLDDPRHRGVQRLVRDLNRLYTQVPAMHVGDCDPSGFEWLVADDNVNSVYAFVRHGRDGAAPVIVACNMTPVARQGYRIGAPWAGRWREVLNSDAATYGGSNLGNGGAVETIEVASHGQPCSLDLVLPPLATIILHHEA